jgi:hypothetical protein
MIGFLIWYSLFNSNSGTSTRHLMTERPERPEKIKKKNKKKKNGKSK